MGQMVAVHSVSALLDSAVLGPIGAALITASALALQARRSDRRQAAERAELWREREQDRDERRMERSEERRFEVANQWRAQRHQAVVRLMVAWRTVRNGLQETAIYPRPSSASLDEALGRIHDGLLEVGSAVSDVQLLGGPKTREATERFDEVFRRLLDAAQALRRVAGDGVTQLGDSHEAVYLRFLREAQAAVHDVREAARSELGLNQALKDTPE